MPQNTQPLISKLTQIVGAQGVLTAAADLEPYVVDWRGVYRGTAAAVVRPANTEQVAAIVQLCAETGTPLVPQGGNTGMCGASIPNAGSSEVVLSLARMNKIISVDQIVRIRGFILSRFSQVQQFALTPTPLPYSSY